MIPAVGGLSVQVEGVVVVYTLGMDDGRQTPLVGPLMEGLAPLIE